jgi:hypothetical protein
MPAISPKNQSSAMIHLLCVNRRKAAVEAWTQSTTKIPFVVMINAVANFAEAENFILQRGLRWMVVGDEQGLDASIDFIANVRSHDTRISTLLISKQTLPLFVAEPLGIVAVIPPNDEIQQPANHILKLQPVAAPSATMSGSLGHMSLVDLIQIYCMRQKKDALKITSVEGEAWLYFNEKGICHCVVGDKQGVEAFNLLVNWTNGSFENMPKARPSATTITDRWEGLLLDALRLKDEDMAQTA